MVTNWISKPRGLERHLDKNVNRKGRGNQRLHRRSFSGVWAVGGPEHHLTLDLESGAESSLNCFSRERLSCPFTGEVSQALHGRLIGDGLELNVCVFCSVWGSGTVLPRLSLRITGGVSFLEEHSVACISLSHSGAPWGTWACSKHWETHRGGLLERASSKWQD